MKLNYEFDYLIIGQGIAGTNIAFELLNQNKTIFVIDYFKKNSSSRVSAGICNPITGKRLTKSWQADIIFPYLVDFYTRFEDFLKIKFLRKLPVYRTFKSIENQNEWYVRTAQSEWADFCSVEADNAHFGQYIDNPLGGWQTLQSYQVEVNILLENFRNYLKKENLLSEHFFDYEKISFFDNYITYSFPNDFPNDFPNNFLENNTEITLKAKKIIFCEGIEAQKNPFFQNLDFNFVKGEWIKILPKNIDENNTINAENHFLEGIISQEGLFVLPNIDQTITVGATYEWGNMSEEISENARKELTEKLDNFLKIPYTIIDQQAGIRPASKNREPFLLIHSQYKQLALMNGLGTKGVSLSPYFAKVFYKLISA